MHVKPQLEIELNHYNLECKFCSFIDEAWCGHHYRSWQTRPGKQYTLHSHALSTLKVLFKPLYYIILYYIYIYRERERERERESQKFSLCNDKGLNTLNPAIYIYG